MSIRFWEIKPLGERSILVEFEPEIGIKTLEKIILAKETILDILPKEKVEVVTAYSSLLVIYHYTIEDVYSRVREVKSILNEAKIGKILNKRLFYIPVCYDVEYAWDLQYISRKKNMPVDEIIQYHTEPTYTVYFIGFLPGFLYLGGLPEILNFPRKTEPRMEVPKGAVGIGGNQTGIYPKKSPGGWQIIGNSPVSFFDKNKNPPCQISAGDKVKFYPVSQEEYMLIKKEVQLEKFHLKTERFYG